MPAAIIAILGVELAAVAAVVVGAEALAANRYLLAWRAILWAAILGHLAIAVLALWCWKRHGWRWRIGP